MSNDTSCSPFGNCTILAGTKTNGTIFTPRYNESYPVPYWHQNMELATICLCNSLTLIVIFARLIYRWKKFRRWKGDDVLMAVAGFFLVFLYASQLGAIQYGSGLHMQNVPRAWRKMHWHFQFGFSAYYLVVSCIKLSVCFCFIQICRSPRDEVTEKIVTHSLSLVSHNLKGLRYCVYGLCVMTAGLGLTCASAWSMGCQPFLANFLWTVSSESCVNYDIFRWLWISVSVPIDMVIMGVPLRILKRVRLRDYEKRILQLVFCATLLGTICCIVGIYGSFVTRTAESQQLFYQETVFVMLQVTEIFAYALGATFPVLSRYIIAAVDHPDPTHANFSSWARDVPDFFLTPPRHIPALVRATKMTPRAARPCATLHRSCTPPSSRFPASATSHSPARPRRTSPAARVAAARGMRTWIWRRRRRRRGEASWCTQRCWL
ncbi:plasma membrane protein, partial [Diplocarpon rosae]